MVIIVVLSNGFTFILQFLLSPSTLLIECMINRTQYNGDLAMDFVIFQGTRFDDAFVQKSCCDLG